MNRLLSRFLYRILHSPVTYFAHIGFLAYISIQWFVGQRFFAGAGTTDLHRFFAAFPFGFILYVPLIVSSCRIKGQWSFPFSSLEVTIASISASFLTCTAANLLTMTVPAAVSIFGNVEGAQFFCGYFGILLFTLCAVSFTTLAFTLINGTAAAFVVSVLGLALCNSIHNIPLYADAGVIFSAVIKSISFAWNFDSFAKGIIDLRQILYFLLASGLFIFLICFTVEKKKGNKTETFRKAARLFGLTFILSCAVTSLINLKADITKSKKFSVTTYSRKITEKITEPVSITYYLSSSLKNLYPQVKDVSDYLEAYASVSDLISFRIVNPAKDELKKKLSEYGINGQPVRTNSISSSTVTSVYSAVVIDYLGMTETIPFVLSAATLEFDLAQKINSLIEEKKKLVQIVCANGLNFESDYSYLFPYLKSLGYVPFISQLPSAAEEGKSFGNFPKVPLIVLGSENFSREDTKELEKFLLDGGKAFIASQPYSVNIKDDWSVTQNENQLYFARMLFTFGIYFKPTLTGDISNFRITMVSDSKTDGNSVEQKTEYINYSLWPVLRPQTFAPDGMTTFWPCAFDLDEEVAEMEGFSVNPILMTSTSSWQIDKLDGKFITSPFACPAAPEGNETKGQFNIAAAVSLKDNPENLRLILMGDQYALSTPMIAYSSGEAMDFRSMEFLGNGLLLLNGDKELLALKNKSFFNYSLYKVSESDFGDAVRKTFILCFMVPVALILSAGLYFAFIRRKFYR
ncbi:GldG family protein [Treponema sp.]|uniref:GldG family protein n=1 Tax=Treponema sp. TaxID=166 RepID=UPI00298E8C06|nr:GldG family protein [Treponema sp.]MCQ2241478.1 GldG family protein [Treponema sp.]